MLSQKKLVTIALLLGGSQAAKLQLKNRDEPAEDESALDADMQSIIDETAATDMHEGTIAEEHAALAQLVTRALAQSKNKSAPPTSSVNTIQGPSNVYGKEAGDCRTNGSGGQPGGTYRVNQQLNEATCVDICDQLGDFCKAVNHPGSGTGTCLLHTTDSLRGNKGSGYCYAKGGFPGTPVPPPTPESEKKGCAEKCSSHGDCASTLFCCPNWNLCMDRQTYSTAGPNCDAHANGGAAPEEPEKPEPKPQEPEEPEPKPQEPEEPEPTPSPSPKPSGGDDKKEPSGPTSNTKPSFRYSGEESCEANVKRWTGGCNTEDFAYYFGRGQKYEDKCFEEEHALFWRGQLTNNEAEMANSYLNAGLTWARPDEIQKSGGNNGDVSLWGSSGRPVPGGIQQGSLGDCWFLSSASSLAEYPERIEKLFTNTKSNAEGIYEVEFQSHTGPIKEVVDDRIPVTEIPRGYVGAGTKRPFNSGQGANGGWWLPILEKAYAKFNGFYANLNGGQPEQALREMSGMPSVGYRTNSQSSSDIYSIVDNADKKHWTMTAACHYQYDGLVTGHAYSMLGAITLNGDKLLKMRNPWGKEKYTGPYSDNDGRWTASLKQQAGFTAADDGTFFMPVANFKRAFASYTVLMYQDWHKDSTHVSGSGDRIEKSISFNGSQKMIATLNYINPRQTAPGCNNGHQNIYYNLYLLSSRGQSLKQVAVSSQTAYGSFEFDLEAGTSYKLMVKNWDQGASRATNDFTLSTYGEKSTITIQ